MSKPPSDGLGLALGVTAVAVTAVVALASAVIGNSPDRPGDDDRYFTGTIASKPIAFDDSVEIEIRFENDTQTHVLADVAPRNMTRTCGAWEPGDWLAGEDTWQGAVGSPEVEKRVADLLPVGTKVEGYLANHERDGLGVWDLQEIATGGGNTIGAFSYLHLGKVEGTSVSETLVTSGWAEPWHSTGHSLDLKDSGVEREHRAVLAVEKRERPTPAEVVCGDREREQDREAEERRERRHAHHLAVVAAARERHRETLRLYGGDRWIHTMGLDQDNGSSGGSGARCYNSGGNTYSAC